uniref:Photosystem II core complex proteins psbY, chloroplastic n=1 Tax=Araucaria cunninghamii TaxID=56994 RepID=A0A0D6QWZ4_ARACU
MAMTMAATARGPSLARTPPLAQPQRFLHQKPLCVQTRRFSCSAAKLEKASLPKQTDKVVPAAAMGAALVAALSSGETAVAAQQVMELADSDNRGSLLLLTLVPAIGWVLFNILQPALNQLNRMRNAKGLVACAGLGSGAATAVLLAAPPEASAEAQEVLNLAAEAAGSDNRGLLLLLVVSPAIGWVLFNILQPALNQINRMRSG